MSSSISDHTGSNTHATLNGFISKKSRSYVDGHYSGSSEKGELISIDKYESGLKILSKKHEERESRKSG